MAPGNVARLSDRHVDQPQNVAQEVRLNYKPRWELLAGEARGDENILTNSNLEHGGDRTNGPCFLDRV